AARRAAVDLEVVESCVVDQSGRACADPFEDGDQVDLLSAAIDTRCHRSAGHEDRRDVHASRVYQHAGPDLAAVRNSHHPVEAVGARHRFDGIGDQLAGGQGVVHPRMAHDDTVIDADRVELERNAAGFANRLLHHASELLQVNVAGYDVDVGVAHRD